MTQSILDKIKAYKLEDVAARKAERPQEAVEADARAAPPVRGFAEALHLASREGAACLSVLTDGPSFQGADDYLIAARAAVDLPVLRKDFLYDPWQVAESRALGADCILIIMASVSDAQAAELEAAAAEWDMDALIEVHNKEEMERALLLDAQMIGINNRDLNTFETSLDVTKDLVRRIPGDRLVVSESGLSTAEDLAEMARYGTRCFLIGESLMREEDVTEATRKLLADPLVAGR